MEQELLKKILVRLRRDELEKTLKKWSKLSKQHPAWGCSVGLDFSTPKTQILPQLYKRLTKIKPHHVGELDLLCLQQHSSSKNWTVWLASKIHGNEDNAETPQIFRKRLKSALETYFMLDVQVLEHQEALWIRIYVHEGPGSKYQPNNTVYAVYYPRSPVLIMTAIKAANRAYIIQALCTTIKAGEIKEQMLSGHCLTSLAQLSLNKYSQGHFSHYRLGQVDINALTRGEKRKRKEEEEELDERITYENIEDKERNLEILQDTFGSNEQPILDKLEYKLETSFRGDKIAPQLSSSREPFRCRVKFEGSNVLEGIKNLGKAGYATLPLPAHLAKVSSLAKNTIVVANKKGESSDQCFALGSSDEAFA